MQAHAWQGARRGVVSAEGGRHHAAFLDGDAAHLVAQCGEVRAARHRRVGAAQGGVQARQAEDALLVGLARGQVAGGPHHPQRRPRGIAFGHLRLDQHPLDAAVLAHEALLEVARHLAGRPLRAQAGRGARAVLRVYQAHQEIHVAHDFARLVAEHAVVLVAQMGDAGLEVPVPHADL